MSIAGAVSSSYVVASVSSADAGAYSVVVSNACGSMTSATAVLTVDVPDVDHDHGAAPRCDRVRGFGHDLLRHRVGNRSARLPVALEWSDDRRGDVFHLPIAAATPASAGAYDVTVSGLCNSVVSDPAILTVVPSTPGVTCPSVVAVGTGCGGAGMPAFACTRPTDRAERDVLADPGNAERRGVDVLQRDSRGSDPIGLGMHHRSRSGDVRRALPGGRRFDGRLGAHVVPARGPGLVGLQAGVQIALFPTAGPLGLDLSNGLYVTIGS